MRRVFILWVLAGVLVVGCITGLSPGGAWQDQTGNEVPTDVLWSWVGQERHCGWGSATFLWIGRSAHVPGIPEPFYDQYVRDPEDLFSGRLGAEFEESVELPADAAFTGYATPRMKLWVAPSFEAAVFIEVSGRFEQWPRVEGPNPILCA